MSVRLAFAVTVEVDADVLLIDEVLAVGDAAFQQKCFEQFEQLKREGRTIVLVTHDMTAVERFCDRAMLIDRGTRAARSATRTRSRWPTTSSTSAGSSRRRRRAPRAATATRRRPRSRTPGSRTTPASGSRTLPQGEPCTIVHGRRASTRRWTSRSSPSTCATSRATSSSSTSTDWRGEPVGDFAAGETARVRVRFDNWLAPNRYTVSPSVARAGTGDDVVDLREDLAVGRRPRHARDRRRSPTCRTSCAWSAR